MYFPCYVFPEAPQIITCFFTSRYFPNTFIFVVEHFNKLTFHVSLLEPSLIEGIPSTMCASCLLLTTTDHSYTDHSDWNVTRELRRWPLT